MNDDMLRKVTGGDFGDSKYEHDNNVYLYKVGDTVEVYSNILHVNTKRAVILEVKKGNVPKSQWSFSTIVSPLYKCRFDDGSLAWASSNTIERK